VEERGGAWEPALVYSAEQRQHEHPVDGREDAVVDDEEGDHTGLRHPHQRIVRLCPQHAQDVESPYDHVLSWRLNDACGEHRRQGLAGPPAPEDLARVSNVRKDLAVVGLSGSPSVTSKSRVLVEYALGRAAARGARAELVDLAALPADALLGRGSAPAVVAAIESATRARIVVAGTPVYRATYSGLLKVFFDLLPQDSLIGKIGVPIVTGHDRGHSLALDHGLRPLFASLGATVVASGVYGTSAQFQNGKTAPELLQAVDRAVDEALALAGAAVP